MKRKWSALAVAAVAVLASCKAPAPPPHAALGDPNADPYLAAMAQNDAGYQDLTAQIHRVYVRHGIDTQDSAFDMNGTFKKKGRFLSYTHELGTIPYYQRQVWTNALQATLRWDSGESIHAQFPWDMDAVASTASYDYVLEGTQGSLGIVRFTPLPGTPMAPVFSSLKRWIDPVTGAVHRTEIIGCAGWTQTTVNSNVQPIAANGPYMSMHNETTIAWPGGSHTRITDFSNVVLNTGLPDSDFEPVAMVETGGHDIRTGFVLFPLFLAVGAGVGLIGRKRLHAACAAGTTDPTGPAA